MLGRSEMERVARREIERREKLGHAVGGSGHAGFVSYRIDELAAKAAGEGKIELRCRYVLIVETEFTYYPDNPPAEYAREWSITIDEAGNVADAERAG